MNIDREIVEEIVVAAVPTVVFVVLVVAVGTMYGTDRVLDPTGGIALVATLGAFIVLMAAIGYWLAYQD